ncbi:MAG: glycosyltransferase family 39 protein, partial [Paraprevotella sp.]|nr:glycosyltransferase family 39 protein [Paraprevotella sp.]
MGKMKEYRVFLWVFLALLPVLLLRDFTPGNELRYLSIADEALRNGTFVTFYNHGQIYADKPPLYFWIIMAGKCLFGRHYMWFITLFSLLPAFVTVRVMDRWVEDKIESSHRYTGEWLLMTCGLFVGMAVVLRMDMLMCMFITLVLRTFYRMMRGEGNLRSQTLLFPVYVFLAVFSKGPVGILIPLLSTVVYLLITGRIRTVGRYWGWKTWTVLLVGCALWFGAVYAEGGKEYLNNLLFHQTVDRAVNSFHHATPFYYYFISVWYSILPWSLLLIGLIVYSVYKKRVCTELQKFFLTVIAVTFVMLSCISSKIEVYLLPAFPFIVYLALTFLVHYKWNRWLALSIAIPVAVFCAVLPVFILLVRQEANAYLSVPLLYVAAGVLTLTECCSLYLLYGRKSIDSAIRSVAYGLFLAVFIGAWALPKINGELGYKELCSASVEIAREHGLKDYYVWKLYRPENMDVYLNREVPIGASPE